MKSPPFALLVLAACPDQSVTPAPTPERKIAAEINSGAGDSNPACLDVHNCQLCFRVSSGTNGEELWVYSSSYGADS